MNNLYCTSKQLNAINFDLAALTIEQISEIRKRTPENEIEFKTDENGRKYKSVKGSYMKKKLNLIFGWNWDFKITSHEYFQHSREVVVSGRLIINSGAERIIKEQFGRHYLSTKTVKNNNVQTTSAVNIGDGFKSAATDALKKCASELGICWDVYSSEPIEANETEMSHEEKAIYDRLDYFLKECSNVATAEHVFNDFENNHTIQEAHKELYKSHIERINTQPY